tara:strand:- start:30322 stop:31446 length:1125 start_codon:yes stop_codon:yes gene_type:complete
MVTSKQNALKPLLASRDGVHLTAYLVNRADLIDIKSQLRTAIEEANEWLSPAMTDDDRKRFLEPLESLLADASVFRQMKGNIGLFRNEVSFRILNIPVDVEPSCQVATSFHVKPLLRWLQGDQDFIFLGSEKNKAHLYFGNQDSFKLIETIWFDGASSPSSSKPKTTQAGKIKKENVHVWLNDWIDELTKKSRPKLFLAGDKKVIQSVCKHVKYKNIITTPISNIYIDSLSIKACQTIRKVLKSDSAKSLERALLEFRFAERGNRVKKNIFQISKAVVQGKVRKLVVTDELSIFGKIDLKSGGLAIHPFDLDHEDDCILDDLAQLVLGQGGEVIVAKRNEIPNGRPILAILDDDDENIEKMEDFHYRDLAERFG